MDIFVLDPTQDPEQDTLLSPPLRTHPPHQLPPCFHREVDENGICWLTFDTPGSSANVWNADTLDELDTHIEELHRDSDIRALVIRGAKERIFVAGADLKGLMGLPEEELRELLTQGQDVFNHLESLRIPKVAAIHGACLGGGLEMTLACDWRIASDSTSTRLGLPETQIGLIPAWGGCTRLSRLIGLPRAVDLIVRGKSLRPQEALRMGLVHHVVARENLDALATRLALEPAHPRHHHFHISQVFPIPQVLRIKARYDLAAKTHGHYPAPLQAVNVITHGAMGSFDRSLHLEQDAVRSLIGSNTTRRLIEVFFQKEAASKKLPAALAGVQPRTIRNAAVIGAGVMGSAIAQWLASRGVRVVMCDTTPEMIARGLGRVRKLVCDGEKSGALTHKEARETLDRISTTHERVPMHRQDIVIESAVEDLELKKKIFADVAKRVSPDTILATNTSALSITELAKVVPHPERVIGFHFFNPVHRLPLVEVVTLDHTLPEVTATALRFAQALGKTPILVKDSAGFLVNRILMPYLMEAVRMAESTQDPWTIDDAMMDYGMPMGPLRLLDEVGLDVAAHVAYTLAKAFPGREFATTMVDGMIAGGLLGKKAGKGFYLHGAGRSSGQPNPEIIKLTHPHEDHAPLSKAAITKRLSELIGQEANQCLVEGIAASQEDIELAMILGAGFPPFRRLFGDAAVSTASAFQTSNQ